MNSSFSKNGSKRGISPWLVAVMIVILGAVVVPVGAGDSGGPVALSYDLEVGFFPDAVMDYAGLIEVLEGQRPDWNKEDSMKNYPHMLGKAVVTVDLGKQPCNSVDFYLHSELRAHRVQLGEADLKFSQEPVFYTSNYSLVATRISAELDGLSGKHSFTVTYGGLFNPSCSGSPSNYMRIDSNGAYLRAYGYSLWFPVLLEARQESHAVDFTRVKIKSPKRFTAVFTGRRLGDTIEGGRRISSWRGEGIDLRYAQVTVRPFEIAEKEGIHIYHMDSEKSRAVAGEIQQLTGRLKSYFLDNYMKTAADPQIHIAELPNFASGISSGNMVGMTSGQWHNFGTPDKNISFVLLLGHELVHPFVSFEVDRDNPLAAMVVEGFPSYFHLPAVAEIVGEEWYQRFMQRVEDAYLEKKASGKTRWGTPLPAEKPILKITWDEIGSYKDTFILNDRVRLFMNYIRENLGKKRFKQFTIQLCALKRPGVSFFKGFVQQYLPGKGKEIARWLETNDYPEEFHLKR